MHTVGGAAHLVGQRFLARRQRLGVRHFEDRRYAAQHSGPRASLEVFLVLQPRLAEMHLAVDHAGEDVQPTAIDHLPGLRRAQGANRGDAPGGDADVALPLPVVIDDDAALQNEIERLCHRAHRVLPLLAGRLT